MSEKETTLLKLKEKTESANLPLKEDATNIVFGKGNPNAEILIIGEAPGRNEDLEGKPFVGAAGKQLDKLLNLIGLSIEDVYIANILKYRPPKNRDPKPDEIKLHTPFLIEQIKIIQPKVIVTLGNYSTKFVLGGFSPDNMKTVKGITELHGKDTVAIYEEEEKSKTNPRSENNQETTHTQKYEFTVFPMYHPAAMLYRPKLRETIEADFVEMGKLLKISKTQKNLFDF